MTLYKQLYLALGFLFLLPLGDGSERTAMLELAKQRYRDLLRLRPGDWDARYNLERALRLAPEDSEVGSAAHAGPTEQRRIKLQGSRDVELP